MCFSRLRIAVFCGPVSAIALTAVLFLAPGPADGADAQDALPNVASAPRRMEIPVERVAGSITVITRKEIERRQWRSLVDVLNFVPGVNVVQSGGPGKQTSIFTRGSNSNHTKVLLDGIDLSDPSTPTGAVDPAHLLTENLERIEVMRGPMSALYGSEAVGGVINLVTRRGHGKPGIAVWGEAGGYNTAQQATRIYGRQKFGKRAADWSIGYSTLHTRGFHVLADDSSGDERDGYDNRTFSGRLTFEPLDDLELSFIGRSIDTENEADGFFDESDAKSDTRQLFLRTQVRGGPWRNFKFRMGASYVDHDRTEKGSIPGRFRGKRLSVDWLNDFFIGTQHVVTFGAEAQRASADSSEDAVGFEYTNATDESVSSGALFLQEQFSIGDWFGTLSGRFQRDEDFGSALTYRSALGYVQPDSETRLHANLGTAFKSPELQQLYGESASGFGSFIGNPNLEPEKSLGFELGVEQPFWGDRVRAGVTYFQNRIRNLIERRPISSSLTTTENVARAKTDGFESFVSLKLTDRFYARADWTYLSAENKGTGEDLLRRPKNTLDVRIEGRPLPDATLSLGVRYFGRAKDIDFATGRRTTLPGYTVVDLAANYMINRYFKLFGRVDNLFDRKYEDPDGYQHEGFNAFVGLRGAY